MTLVDLKSEAQDGTVCVSLRGEIDLSNAPGLREQLTAMVTNEELGLVLDLREVDYLDSAGIHLLQQLRGELKARGQTLVLVFSGDSVIAHTLRLAGLRWDSEIFASVDEAREALLQMPHE